MIKMLSMVVSLMVFLGVDDVLAEEVISSFESDINIARNGVITVTENIAVNAENININRGIYRDFPTQYLGSFLTQKSVGFELISVQRNGQPEPHHIEKLSNGFRIYVGSKSTFLKPGLHQYQLVYKTDKQLGFFKDHDEFYWNVTGNGWTFRIIKAEVTVSLPDGARDQAFNQQAWTGYQGETEQHFKINNTQTQLGFVTTQTLNKHQGLTIGLSFPKGVFTPPPWDWTVFLKDNLLWLLAVACAVFYLLFYLTAWYRLGRDPEPGTIMTRFYAPENLSPAAVHYIENEGANNHTLTSAVLSLAVKGYLFISQQKKSYSLKKLNPTTKKPLSKGESMLLKTLFKGQQTEVHINGKYHANMASAKSQLVKKLQQEYHHKCFKDNRFYVIWAWVISVLCFVTGTLLIYQGQLSVSMLVGMVFATMFTAIMALAFAMAAPIIAAILVLIILSSTYLQLMQLMVTHSSWLFFCLFLLTLNLLFGFLMRAPTPFGRHIKDQIDGLKRYMKAAEQDRLNLMNPPQQTLQHYEALLPYAVALGLENQWAQRFTALFNTEQDSTVVTSSGYQPSWVNHSNNFTSSSSVTDWSRTLRRTLASASEPPTPTSSASSSSYSSSSSSYSSSSSSSSSSGSSGGGGSGGGGGGW